jgi:hypothetical protein
MPDPKELGKAVDTLLIEKGLQWKDVDPTSGERADAARVAVLMNLVGTWVGQKRLPPGAIAAFHEMIAKADPESGLIALVSRYVASHNIDATKVVPDGRGSTTRREAITLRHLVERGIREGELPLQARAYIMSQTKDAGSDVPAASTPSRSSPDIARTSSWTPTWRRRAWLSGRSIQSARTGSTGNAPRCFDISFDRA